MKIETDGTNEPLENGKLNVRILHTYKYKMGAMNDQL